MKKLTIILLFFIILNLISCSEKYFNKTELDIKITDSKDTEHILKVFTWETYLSDKKQELKLTELKSGEVISVGWLYELNNDGMWGVADGGQLFTDTCITAEYDGPISMDIMPNWKGHDFFTAYGSSKNYVIDPDNYNYDYVAQEIKGANSLTTEIYVSKAYHDAIVFENFDPYIYCEKLDNISLYSRQYLTQQLLSNAYDDVPDKYYNVFRNVSTIYLNIKCYKTVDMSLAASAKIELKFMDGWHNISNDELYKITGLEPPQKWTAELVDYWQVETGE